MTKRLLNSILFLLLIISCDNHSEKIVKLPILGNYDIVFKKVNGKEIQDTVYPTIPKFVFLNEDSVWVRNSSFKGKIWIAEFFFATCPTICPVMNSQMKRFVKDTKNIQDHLQILSFTINPENDSPSVLQAYKQKYQISNKNWTFLTGVKEEDVHRLGIENFLVFAGKDDEAAGGFAHSGAFTLVDKKGQVRGVYQITNYDTSINEKEYQRLLKEVNILMKEYGK